MGGGGKKMIKQKAPVENEPGEMGTRAALRATTQSSSAIIENQSMEGRNNGGELAGKKK